MSDYSKNQISRTIGLVTIVGLIVTMPNVMPQIGTGVPSYNPKVYSSLATSPTMDQVRNALTGEYSQQIDSFEVALVNIYSNLIATQETLGIEFEKVLYDNLWDLYES